MARRAIYCATLDRLHSGTLKKNRIAGGSGKGVKLEPEGLFGKDRSSPSLLYGPSRGLHLFSDNDCATRWSIPNKPPSRLAPQQQTVRLHLDHSDGEQEFQPDKREFLSSLQILKGLKLPLANQEAFDCLQGVLQALRQSIP